MLSALQYFVPIIVGLVLHWTYFIHGEKDLLAATIARKHILAGAIIMYLKCQYEGLPARQAIYELINLSSIYASTIFTSISIYRLLLSPLCGIPGPLGMRISKLTHVWTLMDSTRQNFNELHRLRSKYGSVVRTGPNEVTLFGYDAYHKVHGSESNCGRSAYYDILHPMVSLDTTRDPAIHMSRRKLWDQAFSIKALKENEKPVYNYAMLLMEKLRQRMAEKLDLSTWFEYYTFDLMGSLGLTIDFNNLTTEGHPILNLWHIAHKKLGPLNSAPWIKHLLMGIPFIERIKYYRQFMRWAHDELDNNIKLHTQNNKCDRKNIIGLVLSDAIKHGGVEKNWNFVLGDFVLVVAAGSDPVRLVLSNAVYYLLRNPEHLAKVRQELSSIDVFDYNSLQSLQHLTACIYETLRLHPAVPSAGLRMAPEQGITINGVFIPGGTTLVTPQYSLHRDEDCFLEPNEWIPERFTTKPELILNKNAFVPWSIGKMACLGKNLSMMEIRVALALLLTHFNIHLAPGEDGTELFSHATDFFTTTPGAFNVFLESHIPLTE